MCQPDHGHVIPHLAVVAELVRRGNRVTYLTAPAMARHAEGAGATVLAYDSAYRSVDLRKLEDDPLGLLSLFLDESAAMLRAADGLRDRPDLIVYDISILHAGRILARKWGLPATQLIPVFASNEHFSYLSAIYGGQEAVRELPGWVDGMLARTRELALAHGVRADPAELWWEVQDANLVNLPRSFQFAGETFDERFAFVGPCLGERAFLSGWEPPGDGLPVALLSFGTVASGRPDLVRTCVRAFAELPWHGVVTLGDGMDPAELGPLPPTIEVHRWVSHLAVLAHASVAVTHGGMGTAMETLYWGCPMVVVPATAIDRPPARRVAELGLGQVVEPAELTPERLVDAVLAVAADPRVKRNAEAMRGDIRAAGGTPRAADELERHLARAV
ncbi:glycosyl transferase [Nonomuraea glycinis]|uniref:Glycosyl transferase n=1 Tax=Nonomuraea glycinis TaxID=2047744 RepID=A0A918AFN2_9ACTN|nr:macrolide family glycosyltransferase [Nonomuraea glycinis]MCA2183152.1 glycosyl transferase [Nonomuraea glycinis]GGP17846.1 glycosyl transferase [Nonomuraea glycinis]